MRIDKLLLLVASFSVLSACSSNDNALPTTGYRTARAQSSLEIPPDLVNSSMPTLQQAASAEDRGALPPMEGIKIRSTGDKRWIEVAADANTAWIKMVDYFNKSGLPILIENKRDGILETDWMGDPDSDSKSSAFVRSKVGDLFGRAPVNDKFVAWLEQSDEQHTSIHVKHTQLKQYVIEPKSERQGTIRTGWTESEGDGFKEMKLLRDMAAFFGGAEIETENTARVVLIQNPPAHILLAEPSDKAWSLVERAIVTSPYSLDGEDRQKNLFSIVAPKETGFWSKLTPANKYGLVLEPYGDQGKTRIRVTNKKGKDNVEHQETLPVLWAIAGELRRMESAEQPATPAPGS